MRLTCFSRSLRCFLFKFASFFGNKSIILFEKISHL
nr:MAG TPA: hypothetical protein [Caudoviricetes sp.]